MSEKAIAALGKPVPAPSTKNYQFYQAHYELIRDEITRLQSEVERLRGRCEEAEIENERVRKANLDCVAWEKACKADLGRALARVAELSSVMRSIIDREQTGEIVHRCQAALDNDNSVARDLRKQAEAVEAFGATTWTSANRDSRYWLGKVNDYAQRLRQQADEAEKAGG